MANRKRPRHNKPIRTVLQAFQKVYGNDLDAYDSMILSLSPGEGIEIRNGNLNKFEFYPANEYGILLYNRRARQSV